MSALLIAWCRMLSWAPYSWFWCGASGLRTGVTSIPEKQLKGERHEVWVTIERGHHVKYFESTVSWYSDWLRTGWPKDRSSSPGSVKNSHFSISPRLALGSNQPLIQWLTGSERPESEADDSPLTVLMSRNVDLYIHSFPPDSTYWPAPCLLVRGVALHQGIVTGLQGILMMVMMTGRFES
jgi:hypothetical protein